jgi:hypothetical protein
MKRKISTLLSLGLGVFLVTGFYSCGPPPLPQTTSGGGFLIQTEFTSSTGPLITIVPNVTTHWDWKQDVQGFNAGGDASSFSNTTNILGLGESLNGRAPAIWNVQWLAGGPSNCIGAPDAPGAQFQSNPQRVTEVICTQIQGFDQIVGQGDFVFTPHPIYTDGSSGCDSDHSGKWVQCSIWNASGSVLRSQWHTGFASERYFRRTRRQLGERGNARRIPGAGGIIFRCHIQCQCQRRI